MNDWLAGLSNRMGGALVLVPTAALGAAIGFVVAGARGPLGLAIAGWVLGAALVCVDVARSGERDGAGYAREISARVLLFAGATIRAVEQVPERRVLIWVTGFVLIAATVSEPLLLRALPRREVVNLPGYRPTTGAFLLDKVRWATCALVLLAGLVAVVRVPVPVRWLLLAAGLAVGGGTAWLGLLSWRDRLARRQRLHASLRQYAPQFVVYTGREDGGSYQLQMWLPHLVRLGVPFAIIVRRQAAARVLARITDVPIVSRSSLRALDDVVVDSIKVAFYVNSVASNSDLVAYRNMRHVYLGHGDSDKSLSHHPVHAMYDQVFVAGRAAIERYRRNGVRMRADAFVVVGRPQLEAIKPARRPMPTRPTVLYAPTWIGYNSTSVHSSLTVGYELVSELLTSDVSVIFRPHPFSRRLPGERDRAGAIDDLLRQDAARTGRAHRYGPGVDAEQFGDTANDCDVLISDMSSIMVDFLGSDKPMAVMVRGAHIDDFVEQYPVSRGAYLIEFDRANLTTVLDAMLGADPMRGARARVRDYYLGGLTGAEAAVAFAAAATACLEPMRRPVATGHVFRPAPPPVDRPPIDRPPAQRSVLS